MSGHSKWHNIQQRKGKQDAKRGNTYSKFAKLISISARNGGDPENNFSLRLAIDRAKQAGVPKDNIERAIKTGTGETKGSTLEENMYECYGPGGVAVLVKTVTDNKNRTVAELKHLFSKSGGSMGGSGSVLWMFEQRGVIVISKQQIVNRDEFELQMMDVGAEDIQNYDDDKIKIETKIDNLRTALDKITEMGIEVKDSGLEWIAKDSVAVSADIEEKLNRLFEQLADNDDVEDFYTNAG